MGKRIIIKNQVMLVLESYARKGQEIPGKTRILEDLALASLEDLEIIGIAEKITHSTPPQEAWKEVVTVDQMIDLLCTHSLLPENPDEMFEMERAKAVIKDWKKGSPLGLCIVIAIVIIICAMWYYLLNFRETFQLSN
jgi:hypothetical protein